MTAIHGTTAPGFELVREAFASNFSERSDVGAAVALVIDGKLVVDLWGGVADPAEGREWNADTLANIWSTTKGVTAACFAMLVDRGQIDYDLPVAHYWPEFGVAGKEKITVAMMLSHQAGLCGFRDPATIEDFYDAERAAARLAEAEPFWEPGTQSGYHAITIGFLATALLLGFSLFEKLLPPHSHIYFSNFHSLFCQYLLFHIQIRLFLLPFFFFFFIFF